MQGKLTVAAALHFQLGDNVQRGGTEHLVLLIRQRDGGSDNDRVARVNAHGIEIFHGADGYNVALAVADNLEFYLFPAAYALFDKHLGNGGQAQSVCGNVPQFVLVVGDTAAGAA